MTLKNKISIILFMLWFPFQALAQDDLFQMLEPPKVNNEYVIAAFKTTRVVNIHTFETVKKNTLDVRVTHHFGDIAGNDGGIHTFFGIDQAADIRIAFEYGVNERLSVGIGKNKINELFDGHLKYRILRQTENNKMPISVTGFVNAGATIQRAANNEYDNFAHRFSYTWQMIIGRKFNNSFSFQIVPSLLHRNYIFNDADENDIFSLAAGGRMKITKRFAVLADYVYSFSKYRNDKANNFFAPLGIGAELETGGHVFHMFLTNNAGITENNYIANTRSSWLKGEIKFGFNISRVFGGSW